MKINKIACVFGGSGFIGRQVVRELARQGYRVKVPARIPESAFFLKPYGSVGQVVPVQCRYSDFEEIESLVRGSDIVVNCVGILYEKRRNDFRKVHTDLPSLIAQACKKYGVERFVHISALGADRGTSRYAASKLEGEREVLKAFPKATILRPSIVFGEGDNFFNMFARLSGMLPFLPLIGGGQTKFQPVFVGDVADSVLKAVNLSAIGKGNPHGQIYELGGPEILTFRQIYDRIFQTTHSRCPLISLPFPVAKIQGFFMGFLPSPLLTADQVESLKTDNIVQYDAQKLSDLGVRPTALDTILPHYLERYRAGGRFASS